jgi:iron complex transport system substrate-binding protein
MRIVSRLLTASLLAVSLLVLTACGSTPASTPDAASAPNEEPAPTTRSVVDASGNPVEVPFKPERVVALSEPDLDAMLALEQRPVGTISGRGQTATPLYLGDLPAGIPIVGTVSQPVMDQIIELEPDLILAGSLADPQILAQLQAIAPTVSTTASGEDWKTHFKRVGEVLNLTAETEAWFAEYNKRIAEVASKLGPNAGAEVSVVRWMPSGPMYMAHHGFASQVLAEVGLKRPAHQQDLEMGTAHSPALSLELLRQIDGDWLFMGTLNPDGDAAMEAAMATPAFQQLNVVKNGRVVPVDGSMWSSGMGPLAAMGILDVVERELAAE